MSAGADHEAKVRFPADPTFARIGRVGASGIALRQGYEVSRVEALRTAVDRSVEALAGAGSITLVASWTGAALVVRLTNPDAASFDTDQVRTDLEALVDSVTIGATTITLVLG